MATTDATEYDERRVKSNRRFVFLSLLIVMAVIAVEANPHDTSQLMEAAIRYSPEYTRPVIRADGTPHAILHDLNGDGRTDVAMLTILDELDMPSGLNELTRTSRLYGNTLPNPLFIVETYFAGDDSVQSVELGRNPVLGGMELLRLVDGEPFPVAINASTRSAAGTERTLLIYSQGGAIRHLELHESDRQGHQFVDLDENGTTDIVVTSRLPEAGRGYETFMELMVLDRGGYRTRASFGLVRGLQQFLSAAGDMIVAADWVSLRGLVATDEPDSEPILANVFVPLADEESVDPRDDVRPDETPEDADSRESPPFNYPETTTPVTRVVFPIISESPFPYPYLGTRFILTFRAECCGGYPRFFTAAVQLSSNPFDEEPFAFLTLAHPQQ